MADPAPPERNVLRTLRRQRRAIEELRRRHDKLLARVTAMEQRTDLAVARLADGVTTLRDQVRTTHARTQTIAAAAGVTVPSSSPGATRPPRQLVTAQQLKAARRAQERTARLMAVRTQIQNVTNIVNSTQASAYGERGSLLATNNLMVSGNQLFWSLVEPVARAAGVVDAASSVVFTALAPLGTLFTGELLLGNRQHVRFVSGVLDVQPGRVARHVLRDDLAEGFWPEFRARTDVPVTIVIVDPPGLSAARFVARVQDGTLEIRAGAGLDPERSVRVAWTIDTGVGGG